MSVRHEIILEDGDELVVLGTKLSVRNPRTRERLFITNYRGAVRPPPTEPPTEPPPVDPPPPDPEPGEIVFESTFEPGDYELWLQDKGLFSDGNTTVHNNDPTYIVPPEMGEKSLRMKQVSSTTGGGKFPPGESDTAHRFINLVAGEYVAELWRVAHDTGTAAFRVWEDASILGELLGTVGLDESEWRKNELPFVMSQDASVKLEFFYKSPDEVTRLTGIKCALLRIRRK
jgi:hypothetical protein